MTSSEFVLDTTLEQKKALYRLWKGGLKGMVKWGDFLDNCFVFTDYIGVQNYHGMFVGIERDGYTHS